jgi:tetratricopeptide (TPR) repeat protein
MWKGRFQESIGHLNECMHEAQALGDRELHRVYNYFAYLNHIRNDCDQAISYSLLGKAVALQAMDMTGAHDMIIGSAYSRLGEHAQGLRHLRRALARAGSQGDENEESYVQVQMAEACLSAGRPYEAPALCESALDFRRRTGYKYEEARALRQLGATLAELGQEDRASACRQEALQLFDRLGAPEAAEMRAELT